jgi:hypothetical protein
LEFDFGPALVAGLAGTAVMTAIMYMGFLMAMRMDMPMMLGTMFLRKGPAAWLLGVMMHFMMGAAFFVVYAAVFNVLDLETSLAGWGALFGLAHGVAAGMAMGMMGAMHPRLTPAGGGAATDTLPAPGVFGIHVSAVAPMAILGLHVAHGAVGGAIYTSV